MILWTTTDPVVAANFELARTLVIFTAAYLVGTEMTRRWEYRRPLLPRHAHRRTR